MSFAQKIISGSTQPVHFIRCTDSNSKPCYFFFMATELKLRMLKSELGQGTKFDLSRYGQVIYSGFGQKPSAEVLKNLSEKYNFDAESLVT